MINTEHQQLSVRRQSELLKINRSMIEVTPMSQTKNDSKRETFFANY